MTYAEKLKDPRWQKKRLEIMQRDEWKCCNCGASDNTLTVHHKAYINGNDPWEYPDYYLMTLCERCHKYAHFDFETSTTRDDFDIELYCKIIDPIQPRLLFKKVEFYKGDLIVTLREAEGPAWYHPALTATLCRLKQLLEENNECGLFIADESGVKQGYNLFDLLQSYKKERSHLIGFKQNKEGVA